MDFFALRCFTTVARLGSFSRAAEALYRTQSAVSLQVRKLEREVGQPLFDRSHRSAVLTEAGRAFVDGAREVLERLEQLPGRIASPAAQLSGFLSIASNLSLASGLLSSPLREFRRRHPLVHLRLLNRTTRGISRAVGEGEADIGIGLQLEDDPESVTAVIARAPLVLVARRGTPAASARTASVQAALSGPVVHFEEGAELRRHIERALLGGRTLAPVIELPSIELILQFVGYGFGASILPAFAVPASWRRKLSVRGLGRSTEPLAICSCVHRRHSRSRAAAAFLSLVASREQDREA